jgi:hypothetical protein
LCVFPFSPPLYFPTSTCPGSSIPFPSPDLKFAESTRAQLLQASKNQTTEALSECLPLSRLP